MTVILGKHKLSYILVPKVACTSLKAFFFEVENGLPFRDFRTSGRPWWIHQFYPNSRHARRRDHGAREARTRSRVEASQYCPRPIELLSNLVFGACHAAA
jgi:hypothetical protein